MLRVPSGRMLDEFDLKILRTMAEVGFVKYSHAPFKLKSGIESYVYIFGREDLTDNPGLEWLIGTKIARIVMSGRRAGSLQPCLIGIPTAGTALAQAAAMTRWNDYLDDTYHLDPEEIKEIGNAGFLISHRIMREALKQHGAHNTWVNGKPDPKRHAYWLVDNVATNGDSKIEAREKLRQDSYSVENLSVLIFVDRQQGAVERLKRDGFKNIVVVYNLLDLTYAFGELGLWPKSAVSAVEEEIRQHQFL